MTPAQWTFAVAAGVLLYVHVVYPVLVLTAARLRPRPVLSDGPPVPVTIVLAAHDEAGVIGDRITNLLDLDYPPELLHVVVACDGGEDGTYAAASAYVDDRVEVLNLPRVGKAHAMNAAIARARHEVVAFTDANTIWDPRALRHLVAPFADPRVGGAAGDQRYVGEDRIDPVAAGETTYWSLDRALKQAQSTVGSVTSATGAIYAVRRALVDEIPAGVTDDFFVSTGVVLAGQRLVFVPSAHAFETLAPSREDEFARKVRIMTRGLRGVWDRASLLNPWRHGLYAWQLLTHKVLRRLLFVPLVALAISAFVGLGTHRLLAAAAVLQAVFYLTAAVGLLLPRGGSGKVGRLFRLPAYFCLVYAAAAVAVVRVLRGQSVERWGHRRLHPDETGASDASEQRTDAGMTREHEPVSRADVWVVAFLSLTAAAGAGILVSIAPALGVAALLGALVIAVTGLPRVAHAAGLALILLYSNAPVIAAERFGLPTSVVALVVPALLLLAVLQVTLVERRGLAFPSPLTWVLLYFGALATSTVLAPLAGTAISAFVGFLTEGVLLYILIINAVRDTHTLRVCLSAVVATASILAVLSVHQTVTASYDNDYLGFARHSVEDVDAFLARSDGGPARVGGPIGQKNRYAQFLLMVLPIPLVVARHHSEAKTRVAALVATVLCASGVVLTFSRGAVVAATLLLLTLLLMREVRLRALIGVGVVVVLTATALPYYGERLAKAAPIVQGIEGADETDGAVRGRLSSNLGAIRVFLDHPITGVGPGNYPRYHKAAVEDLGLRVFPSRQVHNLYPEVAAETGLVGLFTFGGLLLVTLRELWKVRRRHPANSELGMYATGLMLGLLAYLYAAVFLHMAFERYFWMLMGLAAAVVVVAGNQAGGNPQGLASDPVEVGTEHLLARTAGAPGSTTEPPPTGGWR